MSSSSTILTSNSWRSAGTTRIRAGVSAETPRLYHIRISSQARKRWHRIKTLSHFKISLMMEGTWLNSWMRRVISKGKRWARDLRTSRGTWPRNKVPTSLNLGGTRSKSRQTITMAAPSQCLTRRMWSQWSTSNLPRSNPLLTKTWTQKLLKPLPAISPSFARQWCHCRRS